MNFNSFQLFEDANKVMYSDCSGLALEDFIDRKRNELSSITDEPERMIFVLEYIDLVGKDLHGCKNFREEILRKIKVRYN